MDIVSARVAGTHLDMTDNKDHRYLEVYGYCAHVFARVAGSHLDMTDKKLLVEMKCQHFSSSVFSCDTHACAVVLGNT